MKQFEQQAVEVEPLVAPFTGAWIETVINNSPISLTTQVAPFTGAWIETKKRKWMAHGEPTSLPSRERGLKLAEVHHKMDV